MSSEKKGISVGCVDLMCKSFVDGEHCTKRFASLQFEKRWPWIMRMIASSDVMICAFRNMSLDFIVHVTPFLVDWGMRMYLSGSDCLRNGVTSGFFVKREYYDAFTFNSIAMPGTSSRIITARHTSGITVCGVHLPSIIKRWDSDDIQHNHMCAGMMMCMLSKLVGPFICVGGFGWDFEPNAMFDIGLLDGHDNIRMFYPSAVADECKSGSIGSRVQMPWDHDDAALLLATPERIICRGGFTLDHQCETIVMENGTPVSEHKFCSATFVDHKYALSCVDDGDCE